MLRFTALGALLALGLVCGALLAPPPSDTAAPHQISPPTEPAAPADPTPSRTSLLLRRVRRSLGDLRHRRGPDPAEAVFYSITTLPTPPGTALEVGSLELLPHDSLAIGTRRGDVWILRGAAAFPGNASWDERTQSFVSPNTSPLRYHRFASGLHEVFGLALEPPPPPAPTAEASPASPALFATTRTEIVRLRDTQGTGHADSFETVCAPWGVSGDYHEYTFGSRFDPQGNLWAVCCLTGSFRSDARFRG
ncbi:MAG: hypothetical protein RLZZ142_1156, partial [Verrucomicrobiota bacterium]